MKIAIEANIGAGKTTIMQMLNKELRIPIFLEPVEEWKELLELYYNNQDRWAFSLNTKVLLSFSKWKNNNYKALYERSSLSCKNVFAKLNLENGNINNAENILFNQLYEEFKLIPDVIIYLRTDPEISYDRLVKRNRDCEKNVELKYIKSIHQKYENMIKNQKNVYVINANNNLEKVYSDVKEIIVKLNNN